MSNPWKRPIGVPANPEPRVEGRFRPRGRSQARLRRVRRSERKARAVVSRHARRPAPAPDGRSPRRRAARSSCRRDRAARVGSFGSASLRVGRALARRHRRCGGHPGSGRAGRGGLVGWRSLIPRLRRRGGAARSGPCDRRARRRGPVGRTRRRSREHGRPDPTLLALAGSRCAAPFPACSPP